MLPRKSFHALAVVLALGCQMSLVTNEVDLTICSLESDGTTVAPFS